MNKIFIAKERGKPFIARDGALIFELFSGGKLPKNISLATGFLKPGQKAIPHYHKKSEEIYFVLEGRGKVKIAGKIAGIKKGEAVLIPPKAVHALINNSKKPFKVLAISSPAYQDKDMIFTE